ncbi:hypothetical protein AHiyo4_10260 [Arthrobacter sp. Hiyo4]|nr:hypothetical protein AHiyo4_10260 [Arthrobacter sp. Hiyo4]
MARKNPHVEEANEADIEVSGHPKTWAAGVPASTTRWSRPCSTWAWSGPGKPCLP